MSFARNEKINRLEGKTLGEKLINTLLNYTSLPRKGNRLYVFGKQIKSEYDRMGQVEDRDHKRENGDREGEDGGHEE